MKQTPQILLQQASRRKLAPLFKRGSSVEFEGLTISKVASEIETVVD